MVEAVKNIEWLKQLEIAGKSWKWLKTPKPPFLERLDNGRGPLKICIQWHRQHTTDTHHDLETESTKWVNSVKIYYIFVCFFTYD